MTSSSFEQHSPPVLELPASPGLDVSDVGKFPKSIRTYHIFPFSVHGGKLECSVGEISAVNCCTSKNADSTIRVHTAIVHSDDSE
jgi:hypothetical protein